MKHTLLAATALVALCTASMAADLPSTKGAAPFVAPLPIMTWQGFYVGGQFGGTWAQDKAAINLIPFANQSFKSSSAIGGIYAGYNWDFNNFVLGVEADANVSGLSKTVNSIGLFVFGPPSNVQVKSNFEGALVAKAGFTFNDFLLYALGGVSIADFQTNYNLFGTAQSNSNTRVGWTAGAGIAYRFNQNWSARLEYRYADYGTHTDGLQFFAPLAVSHKSTTNRLMAGITYRF